MREGVIGYYVSSVLDFQRDVGPQANVASDHEKRCRNVMLREHVEQIQRMWIIWSVIERERHLSGSARHAAKCPPKPLAPRSHRMVSRQYSRGAITQHGKEHRKECRSAVSHQQSAVMGNPIR